MPCGVMLKSLCENNRNVNAFIVIDESVDDKCKEVLRGIVEPYQGNTLSFILVDGSYFKDFPLLDYLPISRATYYRLLLAEILPTDIDKVIYLDCDVIIRHPLDDFWNTVIDGYAVGCVMEQEIDNIEHYNRLMYSHDYGYFNAGVLLVNLKYWREHNLTKLFMNYVETYPQRILYNDQDVLNGVLHKETLYVSPTYNAQIGFFWKKEKKRYCVSKYGKEIEEIVKDPYILHFSTGFKPWFHSCQHPMRNEFLKYRNMTIWKNEPLYKKTYPLTPLKSIIGDLLRLMRLRKPTEQLDSISNYE